MPALRFAPGHMTAFSVGGERPSLLRGHVVGELRLLRPGPNTPERTGNPNHTGLPNWVPFTRDRRATMVFDNECRLENDPYGEEKRVLSAAVRAAGAAL